jgi:hypothetical protein
MDIMSARGELGGVDFAGRSRITASRVRCALNKRLLRDPPSRKRFEEQGPTLSEPHARVLGELRSRGIGLTSLDEFLGPAALERWHAIVGIADQFLECALSGDDPHDETIPTIAATDPLFGLGIEPVVLDVVNTFFGLWSKLNQYGMKASLPGTAGSSRARVRAERWHRDMRNQVKIFLYLNDVHEFNGTLY